MDASYQIRLEKNVGKYSWFKIFTKRVYLPLIAIQLVNFGHVTISELAFIAGAASIIQLVLQIPTGYLADKWGNRGVIILGSAITAVSPLFYIFMPGFWGGLLAAILFSGGFAFQSGAIEAFMHDTLNELGKEKEYSKVMGRAQSYGLIGNTLLIVLVPATYSIHHNLPFALGFLSLLVMFWLSLSFTYPPQHTDVKSKNPFTATRSVVTAKNIMFFVFAGIMGGVVNKAPDYRELLFQDLGVATVLFGFLLAAGSIVGAVMGRFIHLFDKLKPFAFYLFDFVFVATCMILIGAFRSPVLAVVGFIIFVGYARVRIIVFQAKLLENLKHAYKATLLSALSLFTGVAEIGAIMLLAKLVGFKGYSGGYLLFGMAVFAMGLLLWLAMFWGSQRAEAA